MNTMNEQIKEALENASDSAVIGLWNEYADENSPDDQIYSNDDSFFEENFQGRVMDAVRAVTFGDYRYSADYVAFDGYANIVSFDSINEDNCPVDLDSLADWLTEEYDGNYDELAERLDYEFEIEEDDDMESLEVVTAPQYHDFCDDVDKMRDFPNMTKADFLAFYSYLTEEEYDMTVEKLKNSAN